jgi:hypothetical protein
LFGRFYENSLLLKGTRSSKNLRTNDVSCELIYSALRPSVDSANFPIPLRDKCKPPVSTYEIHTWHFRWLIFRHEARTNRVPTLLP